jgi:hypothetical protein
MYNSAKLLTDHAYSWELAYTDTTLGLTQQF